MERFVVVQLEVDGVSFTASTIDGDLYVVRDGDAKIVAMFQNLSDDGITQLDRKGIQAAAERAVRRSEPPQPPLFKLA